ncbi:MAG: hypothetical protein QXL16_01155 [Candidatus Micrarchaeaceae archaeon]
MNGIILLACPSSGIFNSVNPFLCFSFNFYWIAVAVLVSLAMISIYAVVYQLSPLIEMEGLRSWSRNKIFEVITNLVLIFIFGLFVSLFISFNPNENNYLLNNNLNVYQCSNSNVNNIYLDALCNVHFFNSVYLDFMEVIYLSGVVTSLSPSVTLSVTPLAPANIRDLGVESTFSLSRGIGDILGLALGLAYAFYVLSQVQIVILASALFLFSVFMGVGFIARIFGPTRGLGGVLISLGLGLGLLYPSLSAISYGFINNNLGGFSAVPIYGSLAAVLFSFISCALSFLLVCTASIPLSITAAFLLIYYGGLIAIGITIVPLINLAITDVFVIDFSSAIGERIDILSLLTGLI